MMYYIILLLVSTLFSGFCYKKVFSIAKEKNIVDNPDARKLHQEPVPVLGGITIFIGIIVGVIISLLFNTTQDTIAIVCSMCILLFIGMIDDIVSLSPYIRFVLEFSLAIILILATGNYIHSLYGVFELNDIPKVVAYPLTVIAIVGVINAMNLLDGVDGLSSGYSAMICVGYFVVFLTMGLQEYAYLCLVTFGAICPFFIHNVFGKKSKMFIGDGGTLMIGIIISAVVVKSLSIPPQIGFDFSLITFSIAILCIPVFDTLRVMTIRILNGKSPFFPDKNHLHHAFIRAGFSHIGTSLAEISIGIISVLSWYILNCLHVSVTIQFIALIVLGVFNTFGLYYLLETGVLHFSFISRHLITNTKFYGLIREFVDKH